MAKSYDYGEYKLKDVEESRVYYIGAMNTNVFVVTDRRKLWGYDPVGKLRVYFDGTYMGTPEQMEDWVTSSILDYLEDKNYLVAADETMAGEIIWKLNNPNKIKEEVVMGKLSLEGFAGLAVGGESRQRPGMGITYILIEDEGEEIFYAELIDDNQIEDAYDAYLEGEKEYIA